MNAASKQLDLLIILVCYRVPALTIDCLRSISRQIGDLPNVKVALLDNGSDDGTFEQLDGAVNDHGWGDWVVLSQVTPNRGFAGGNNVLLRQALDSPQPPKSVLLLNTDTILQPGSLSSLLAAADGHPEAGIISPGLEWPDSRRQVSCFRFTNPISELIGSAQTGIVTRLFSRFDVPLPPSDRPFEPQWTGFACVLIRTAVLQQVGLLDEAYYLYFDDVDYCRRAWNAGWRILHWPEARVVHLIGQANPLQERTDQRKRRPRYWYVSRSHYFAKFYGNFGPLLANTMWHAGRSIAMARSLLGVRTGSPCHLEWRDIWTNWRRPLLASPAWRNGDCLTSGTAPSR